MKKIYKAYFESDLTEELRNRIGMFCLDYVYDSHTLMPPYFVAYTTAGEIYEIELKNEFWKKLLKFDDMEGYGYKARVYELEKEGWKKYYSDKTGIYYLVAPDYVERSEKLVGENDLLYADLAALFVDDTITYYTWQKARESEKKIEIKPFTFRNGSIVYWVGNEMTKNNIRSSLDAVVEMAENDDINCFYFSLSQDKSELPEMINEKRRNNLDLVHVIDVPGMVVEDILDTLSEQLESDGRRIFCVIDDLPFLSTREKYKTRIEANKCVIKKLVDFSIEYPVGFVCNIVVSKHARCKRAALDEVREYAPIELFENNFSFFEDV